jgi:hypothetical protein
MVGIFDSELAYSLHRPVDVYSFNQARQQF